MLYRLLQQTDCFTSKLVYKYHLKKHYSKYTIIMFMNLNNNCIVYQIFKTQ